MINGASDYGDVMLDAQLSPVGSGVAFAFQNVLRPVFTGTSASQEAIANSARAVLPCED